MQRAELARINAEAEVERTGRLVETSRFSLSRRIGAPVAGPLDEDWFASVASHYGPLEPIDSADTLALAEAEANVAVAEAGVRLARSQRIPDLTVSAGARRFEETGDTAALIGLSIPLPLVNSGQAALAQESSEHPQSEK